MRKPHAAFTLVEMLAVLSIISVMLVTVAPVVTRIAYGGAVNQALIEVSGSFEQARAYAVANNTYTYVAFATDSTNQLYLMIFGSADGSPGITGGLAQSGQYTVNPAGLASAANPLTLLDKITKVGSFQLQNPIPANNDLAAKNPMLAQQPEQGDGGGTPGPTSLTGNISSPLSDATSSSGGAAFTCSATPAYGVLNFVRAIQFTPDGSARVDRFTPQAVSTVIVSIKGNSLHGVSDTVGASDIWVTGLTGQVTVYQP